jgi:hypothetical protein
MKYQREESVMSVLLRKDGNHKKKVKRKEEGRKRVK